MKLNKASLLRAMHNKSGEFEISGDERAYKASLVSHLFEINIRKSEDTYNFNTIAYTEKVRAVEDMLKILYLTKDYYKRIIQINGEKLFGDILVGEVDEMSCAMIDDTIEYWERISKLEQVLPIKFELKLPMYYEEAELMEELCISFIDDLPVSVGRKYFVDILPTNKEQLEHIEGKQGKFVTVAECSGLKLQGAVLSKLYRVSFYEDAAIDGYRELSGSTEQVPKLRLNIGAGVNAVKYFRSRDDVDTYLRERSEEFLKPKELWS